MEIIQYIKQLICSHNFEEVELSEQQKIFYYIFSLKCRLQCNKCWKIKIIHEK